MWMAYRKMYLYTSIFLAMSVIWVFCEYQFEWLSSLGKGVKIAIAVNFGEFGNYYYRFHVEKKVKQISKTFKSEQINVELEQQGGTSIKSAIGVLVLCLATVFFLAYLET